MKPCRLFAAWISILAFFALSMDYGCGLEAGEGVETPLSGEIAYAALTDGYWQIWVVQLPEMKCTQYTKTPEDKRNPTWGPDGKEIFYRTSDGALAKVSLTDLKIEAVAPSLGFLVDPKVSPSGKRMIYSRFELEPTDNTDLYVYEFSTKTNLRVSDSPDLDYAPSWSPDEKSIAYVSGRGLKKHLLYVMDADGKNKKQLQFKSSDDMCTAWSADGKWILFSSSLSGDYEIWRVHPDGSELQQLTFSVGLDASPCCAPDGSRIVFVSNRGGRLRLWTMGIDGGPASVLLDSPLDCRDPVWWHPQVTEEKVVAPNAEAKK